MGVVEDLADALAQDALQAAKDLGDDSILAKIGDVLGASSATTQEAYNTAVRVRLAERRAREYLREATKLLPSNSE
ncbi:hypothetical protein RB2150_02654 [Rhodobacteraceae bacterium HTCC2150]|nr:hypothetical protein RB2150_02654 [Rhodobacteraceae bacterium HTCC2150]